MLAIVVAISSSNSLLGDAAGDPVGANGGMALPWGGYILSSHPWRDDLHRSAGAVSVCRADGCGGGISGAKSVIGSLDAGIFGPTYDYDLVHSQLVAGRMKIF